MIEQLNMSDIYKEKVSEALRTTDPKEFSNSVNFLLNQANRRMSSSAKPEQTLHELKINESDRDQLRKSLAHGALWFGGSNMHKLMQKAQSLDVDTKIYDKLVDIRRNIFGDAPVQLGRILPSSLMDIIGEG